MGIFTTNKKLSDTAKQIADYQKLADRKNITLPASPTEKKKTGLLSKAGSVLSTFETAPAFHAILKGKNPFTEYSTSVKKGITAKEDISNKISYTDIFEEMGWKSSPGTGKLTSSATWKNFAKEITGLAGDIFLDPTTYLSFGLSALPKLGGKTISKTGKAVLKETAKESAEKIGVNLAKKGIQKTEQELTEAGIKSAGRQLAKSTEKKLFDQGGIKFAGKTLVGGETISKPFKTTQKLLSKTSSGKQIIEAGSKIKNGIGKTFYRDFNLPEKYIGKKQEYLDLYRNDANDIITTMKNVFKDTAAKDREAISLAIEKNDFTKLTPKNSNIAQQAKQIFERIAKEEGNRGLLDNTLEDYVTHIYKDKKKARQYINFMKTGVRGNKTKYAKERVIPTIAEAERLGLKPEKDISNILTARMMASQKAIREQDLLRSVAGSFGKGKKGLYKKPTQMLADDLVEYTSKEFKGLMIPRTIAEDLAKIGKQTINNEELNMFLRGYDAIQNFFKGSVTSLFPAFHGRNFLSNVAQNALDIGIKVLDPIFNAKTLNILRGGKGEFATDLGRKYSYDELNKIMKEKGILGSPGARDVTETVKQKLEKVTKQTVGKQIGRQFTTQALPFRAGRTVGSAIENHARALNFLANIKRGFNVDDAAVRTKQFLFDYDNLSDMEKTVMKRAIPFYTWTRKNIELQGKTLMKRPGVIGAELKTQRLGERDKAEDRKKLPEWIADKLAIKIGSKSASALLTGKAQKSGLNYYLSNMGTPIENFFNNIPQGISKKDIVDYLNKVGSQSAFVPKYITELATGHDFFRQNQVKENITATEYATMPKLIKDFLELKEVKIDYTDNKGRKVKYSKWVGNPYKIHFIRSLPTSRFVSTAGSMSDENMTTLGKLIKNTTGIRVYPVDVEQMENKELKEYLKEVEGILGNYGEVSQFSTTYIPKENKATSIFR